MRLELESTIRYDNIFDRSLYDLNLEQVDIPYHNLLRT